MFPEQIIDENNFRGIWLQFRVTLDLEDGGTLFYRPPMMDPELRSSTTAVQCAAVCQNSDNNS